MPPSAELNEIVERLAQTVTLVKAGRLDEAVSICSTAIETLPRDGTAQPVLVTAYEKLIRARQRQGREGRAMRVYRQYLRDCAPACDPAYDRDYELGLDLTHMPPCPLPRRDRFWSLVRFLDATAGLEGSVAECGCFRGLSSFLLCRRLKSEDADFDGNGYRIFDSFAGLSEPGQEDDFDDALPNAEMLRLTSVPGNFAASLADVKRALAEFPQIQFFPGWIPDAFPAETDTRYRFVHVDVDLYQPTRDSLEYFYPRLVPGARMVCDDYGWPGARKAVDDFCARVGVQPEVTPYLQACIVRRG
jgi:hypothetical protein